jgi:DNA-binding response OmpR family regulator
MRVLVVEDDSGIAAGLRDHLARLGYAVDLTSTLAGAWTALATEPFDIVLLDLGLPDGDGTALLRRLRAGRADACPNPATPVLIMTARDEVASRIAGLDLGADDYLAKPFDPDELAARMRALRRRAAGRAEPTLRYGTLEIDPARRSVLQSGAPVELSAREFSVLLALMEARPRVLSRGQIEAKLYNWDAALDSNAIEVHVHHLRRKLGEAVVRTVRGVGYYVPAEAP